MPSGGEREAIAFAEKVLTLVEEGRKTTTYKYAVLLSLMDLCLENTARSGAPPSTVTTRQVAEKVVELYWPHVIPYAQAGILRQSRGRADQRASILSEVRDFRDAAAGRLGKPLPLLFRAIATDPDGYEASLRRVEWTLIRYPLVLLQRVGSDEVRFLYEIHWDTRVSEAEVKRYQRGEPSRFDNRILLRPSVGEYLVQLNKLLRPFIHRQWTAEVARMNGLEEANLEEFLFGAKRIDLSAVRRPLLELQDGRCFYCHREIRSGAEVDHFLPWSRYPDNGIENLVVADRACNGDKKDFLAAAEHVERWGSRFDPASSLGRYLREVSEEQDWELHPDRTVSVARAIYLQLPDEIRLWLRPKEFAPLDRTAVTEALHFDSP